MRRDLSGLKRPLTSRPLGCEPLEHRALLTSLIAAAEISPGPISEFTAQARSFVESALEQVMVMQHQTPIRATVDSLTQVADDGRPVRITNYTVELGVSGDQVHSGFTTRSVPGSGVPGNFGNGVDSVGAGVKAASSAARLSGAANRSNLVFSFMIFSDNSVSIRARLSNPVQWAGYGMSQTGAFDRPAVPWTPLENDSWLRLSSSQSLTPTRSLTPNVAVSESDLSDRLPASSTLSESNAHEVQTRLDRDGRQANSNAELTGDSMENTLLIDQWIEIEFAADELRAENRARPSATAQTNGSSSPNALLPNGNLQMAQLVGTHGLPLPLGMIELEFRQPISAHHETVDVSSRASAIYQVFVHASDRFQSAATVASRHLPHWAEQLAASTADENEPSRWQSSTLVIAALTGGFVLTRRSKRSEQNNSAHHFVRTSAVPD